MNSGNGKKRKIGIVGYGHIGETIKILRILRYFRACTVVGTAGSCRAQG